MLTLPSEQKDFVEWRQGRTHFAVWALDLDLPVLHQASAEIRVLSGEYWLADYLRQPHLTVGLCGFPVANAAQLDDYALARFTAQCQALLDAAPSPFELEIGAPDSFTSAAYFSVRDLDGGIENLRRTLSGGAEDSGFIPHVTFGLYREVFPLPDVLAKLQASHVLPPVRLRINKLVLMTYEAAIIGGPLTPLGEFNLATGRFEILAPELFEAAFA